MTDEQHARITRQTALSNLILAAADMMAPVPTNDAASAMTDAQSIAIGIALLSGFPVAGYTVKYGATDDTMIVWWAQPDAITTTVLEAMLWVAPSKQAAYAAHYLGHWHYNL